MNRIRTLLIGAIVLAAGPAHLLAGPADWGVWADIAFGAAQPQRSTAVNLLQEGRPVIGLAGTTGVRHYFRIDVAPGTPSLTLRTAGGVGDSDLYLSHNALPEPKSYQFVSNGGSTAEGITVQRPASGPWYALVYGYGGFSGVALTGSWSAGCAQCGPGRACVGHGWIRITAPIGQGALIAGQSYWVQWTTSGHTRNVRVLQSFDDGRSWGDIAPRSVSPAAAGRLLWSVPFVRGQVGAVAARLRIADADNPAIHATSGAWPVAVRPGGGRPVPNPGPQRPHPQTRRPEDGQRRHSRADAFEPDDHGSRASRIAANSFQIRSIYGEGDEDWVMFVPPAPGRYRITFTDVTVEMKVRLYSASVGSTRENKSRTFTVKRGGYALDFDVGPNTRYYKLQIQADDDDDTGTYRLAFQQVVPSRPAGRPPTPHRR